MDASTSSVSGDLHPRSWLLSLPQGSDSGSVCRRPKEKKRRGSGWKESPSLLIQAMLSHPTSDSLAGSPHQEVAGHPLLPRATSLPLNVRHWSWDQHHQGAENMETPSWYLWPCLAVMCIHKCLLLDDQSTGIHIATPPSDTPVDQGATYLMLRHLMCTMMTTLPLPASRGVRLAGHSIHTQLHLLTAVNIVEAFRGHDFQNWII